MSQNISVSSGFSIRAAMRDKTPKTSNPYPQTRGVFSQKYAATLKIAEPQKTRAARTSEKTPNTDIQYEEECPLEGRVNSTIEEHPPSENNNSSPKHVKTRFDLPQDEFYVFSPPHTGDDYWLFKEYPVTWFPRLDHNDPMMALVATAMVTIVLNMLNMVYLPHSSLISWCITSIWGGAAFWYLIYRRKRDHGRKIFLYVRKTRVHEVLEKEAQR